MVFRISFRWLSVKTFDFLYKISKQHDIEIKIETGNIARNKTALLVSYLTIKTQIKSFNV